MIAIIAARSVNNVIGRKGRIPWTIIGEQKQFRELTIGNVVIIGRASYEGIGRVLPGRTVIVVSNSVEYHEKDLKSAASLSEALSLAGDRDVFIAGGYELFKEALPMADKMYITEVHLIIEDGDTFFPPFNPTDFDISVEETLGSDIQYTRTIYTRKTPHKP